MGINQLSKGFTRLTTRSLLLRGTGSQHLLYTSSILNSRWSSKSSESVTSSDNPPEVDLNAPIKYTTSSAASWTAHKTHRANDDMPPYQPLIITLSAAIFLLYFLVFREENDVDEEIAKPIWEKVPGLEKTQLELVLRYNQEQGLETEDVKKRLGELNQIAEQKN